MSGATCPACSQGDHDACVDWRFDLEEDELSTAPICDCTCPPLSGEERW